MLGLIDGDVLLHSSLWQTTKLEQAIANIDYNVESWTDAAFCDDSVIALGGFDNSNYRDDIFPLYKKSVSRVAGRKKRLDHSLAAKKYIASLPNCVVCDNIEADDLLGHWLSQTRGNSVVISVDKDLRQMEGTFLNPHKRVDGEYSEEYKLVSQEEANLFLLEQLLSGDPMDNIPGIPGLGPKKAVKILAEAENKPLQVIEEYKKKFEAEWKNEFLANGKLLFIQREPNDYFSFARFEELFDVSLERVI